MLTGDTLFNIGVFVPILILSATLHEVSHGYAAYLLGDPTAKNAGRLTLNPIAHLDPTGLIVMVLTSIAGFPFGWFKPVPIDTRNFKSVTKGMMITGFAGPFANIALIFVFNLLIRLIVFLGVHLPGQMDKMLGSVVLINLILASLNLIPIPPLDGSRIVAGLLPPKQRWQYAAIEPFGFIILLVLVFTNILPYLMLPIMFVLSKVLWVDWGFIAGTFGLR